MLERASALASVIPGAGKRGVGGALGLTLGEVRGFSLTEIAGFPATMGKVEARIAEIAGAHVPENVRTPALSPLGTILRTGPQQLWIVGREEGDVLERASREIDPGVGCVVDLSHSRTRIFIAGDRVEDVLKKGIPVDLAEAALGAGEAALTGIHHTPVLLHRVQRDRFEIYAMRTFALTVWEWLADAAHEFGYEVAGP